MKTTKDNIKKLRDIVTYVFDQYPQYCPVLTGSLALYLQGIDYGEVNDVDIIFLERIKDGDECNGVLNDIKGRSDVPVQVSICPLDTSFAVVEMDIDGTTVKMTHHSSVYRYLKRLFDRDKDKDKRRRQFQIYEEFIKSQGEDNVLLFE